MNLLSNLRVKTLSMFVCKLCVIFLFLILQFENAHNVLINWNIVKYQHKNKYF